MEIPQTLFHYTSVETLALILKSKQIKFSRLDLVNDPKEGIANDYGNFSQYIFVSCWTDHLEENIALWNIYTPKGKGVRIGFEFPVLKQFSQNGALIDDAEIDKGDYLLMPNIEPITKVEYSDDPIKLYPPIIGNGTIQPTLLGKYKSTLWQFESEYRYILFAIPHKTNPQTNKISIQHYSELIYNHIQIPDASVFININPTSFQNMTITLSPKISDSDKIIVESLLALFNPSAKMNESSLTGRYR